MSGAEISEEIIGPDITPDWDDDLQDVADAGGAALLTRQVTVTEELHGQRLDKALAVLLPDLSRNLIQHLIGEGAVRVQGQVQSRSSTKVKVADPIEVRCDLAAQARAFDAQAMDLAVVHEDADLLVIDKPVGLVVHPAPGHWSGTLLNGLLAHHAGARVLPRAGIVHRLDKDTSGLMVVAKTRAAMDALVGAIARREVQRDYLALAHKAWQGPVQASVEQAIGRDSRLRTRMAVVDPVRQAGKPARTDIRLLASQSLACLVHCKLHTGRTHQIRVHMRHLGHPLLGDALYGGKPLAGLQRQGLHAWRLSLSHPISAEPMVWQRPWPADMAAAAAALGLGAPELAGG